MTDIQTVRERPVMAEHEGWVYYVTPDELARVEAVVKAAREYERSATAMSARDMRRDMADLRRALAALDLTEAPR